MRRSERRHHLEMGLVMLIVVLFMIIPEQASPVQPQWAQFWFCKADGSLINQVLTIKNMEDLYAKDCTFSFTITPFCHNCSDSGIVVHTRSKTCVGMSTKDLITMDWRMEHGPHRNGDSLYATPGETQSDTKVMEKMSECKKLRNSAAQPDNTRTVGIIVALLFLLFY